MKRGFCLIVALFFAPAIISSQELRLPRDPEKLIERVQRFWGRVTAGQRFQALEFVLPEKKDLFLSGNPTPILNAKLVGVDLTANPDHAAVRISLDVLSKEAASGRLNWTITDSWVWRGNNWYLNLEDPPDLFPKSGSTDAVDIKEVRRQIDKNFEILQNSVDLGTLVEGRHSRVEVPIRYTGDVPISAELALPNPLVDVESTPITSRSQHLVLSVGTENWEGPFSLPLALKIRYQAAIVERTLFVKGEVFVPVAFRQSPPNGPIEEGREFSVFVRNNTSQQAGILFISVDARLDVLKPPSVLPPNQEIELVLRLRRGESPDRLFLELDTPLYGRDIFTYRFRNVRR